MDECIYLKLRDARIKQGLSQKELAEKVGLTQQAINRLEQGYKKNIGIELLEKLCRILKIEKIEKPGSFIINFVPDHCETDLKNTSSNIVFTHSDVIEYNRIINKQKNGDGFTPYDKRFISDFVNKSPLVKEWFIENGLKSKEKNMSSIQNSYECLNKEGQREAAKRVEELTEIERYTKPDKWFKGKMSEEELRQAIETYLTDDVTPE